MSRRAVFVHGKAKRIGCALAFPAFLIVMIIVPMWGMRACVANKGGHQATLAYEQGEERYLHSAFAKMQPGETVSVSTITVYTDGDNTFVQPDLLPKILDTAAGNVHLSKKKEPGFDGYFLDGKDHPYTQTNETRALSTVGQQETVFALEMTNRSGATWTVAWAYSLHGPRAVSNTELRSFWHIVNVVPGETSVGSMDLVVVALDQVAEFTGATISFDRETNILTVRPPGTQPGG